MPPERKKFSPASPSYQTHVVGAKEALAPTVAHGSLFFWMSLSRLRLTLGLELEQGVDHVAADVDHHL